jgi:tetratricopeptide (TPR) repeat protein
MASKKWKAFPHSNKAFTYNEAALLKNWSRLHAGDQEPAPDSKAIAALIKATPALKKIAGGKADAIYSELIEAWSAYHRGDFQEAFERGEALEALGASVCNKAQGIYNVYLEDNDSAQLKAFQDIAERALAAQSALPKDCNAFYRRAFALGRYAQGISITKALAQGIGGKVKESLETTLKLAPKHAEAHTALGLYHAEIINKVGALIGGLTYGAKADLALKHFDTALKLTPQSPIAHIEFGNGLLMLNEKKNQADARKAYETAIALKPADAMECLDIEMAKAELA